MYQQIGEIDKPDYEKWCESAAVSAVLSTESELLKSVESVRAGLRGVAAKRAAAAASASSSLRRGGGRELREEWSLRGNDLAGEAKAVQGQRYK